MLTVIAQLAPRSLVATPPSLEDVFLSHYGDELAQLNGRHQNGHQPNGPNRTGKSMTAAAPTSGHRGTTPVRCRPARQTTVGTATMVRLVLRRNRTRLLVWLVVVVGLFAYVGSYYTSLFATQQSLDDFAAVSNTPGIKALTGLAAAPNTLGGAVWTKIWMTCAVSLALGVVFLMTRNGRAEEETGRMELIRSRTLGVHAYSIARYVVLASSA